MRSVRALVGAALAVGVVPAAACATFGTADAPSTEGPAESGPDTLASPPVDSGADASAEAQPGAFCPHGSGFCADFSDSTNPSFNWTNTVDPGGGTLTWSPLGATESGSLHASTGGFTGTYGPTTYLRRTVNATGARLHFEAALRVESGPSDGDTAFVRMYLGSLLLYIYFTPTGWRVDDLYYAPLCDDGGAGPCRGGGHSGTGPPPKLGTWSQVTLDVAPGGAGPARATLTSSSEPEFSFALDPAYDPTKIHDVEVGAGVVVAMPATNVTREILIDDVAFSLSP
jgi:hypothetical protein